MAVELIPSITATTASQLRRGAKLAQHISPVIHLDVMDGKFVPTRSVGLSTLAGISWKRKIEVHAMVKDPASLMSLLGIVKPRRVYLHVELGAAVLSFAALLRSRQIEFGLAINPATTIDLLQPYVRYAKSVLVLAVNPGRYHAPFKVGTIQRIRMIHRRWPRLMIACDGGMNNRTITNIIRAGAKRIIVGSAVMLSNNPLREWKKLRALTRSAAI